MKIYKTCPSCGATGDAGLEQSPAQEGVWGCNSCDAGFGTVKKPEICCRCGKVSDKDCDCICHQEELEGIHE